MYIGKLTATLSILALAGGFAAGAANAVDETGIDDTTGLSAIGIDITSAGSSPAEVQQFVAGLAPETQRGVLGGCQTVVTYPAFVAANVVQFCETALGSGAAFEGPAMGFVPEPQFAPDPMIGPEPNGAY